MRGGGEGGGGVGKGRGGKHDKREQASIGRQGALDHNHSWYT